MAERFVLHFCRRHRRPTKQLSSTIIQHLQALPWPGNVRELRNSIERMVLLSPERRLEPAHLPEHLEAGDARSATNSSAPLPPLLTLAELEAEWIRRTLARLDGNRTETARQLGISRRALHYKLQRMGRIIKPNDGELRKGIAGIRCVVG